MKKFAFPWSKSSDELRILPIRFYDQIRRILGLPCALRAGNIILLELVHALARKDRVPVTSCNRVCKIFLISTAVAAVFRLAVDDIADDTVDFVWLLHQRRIAAACAESGREAGEITLVGASKMNDAAACREAIAAGIDVLGENRVQEMTEKMSQNAYDGAPLHFIGHLQRNKVKQVVGKVALIQSVGSLPLLEAVEKEAEKQDIVQDILLEVNIGGEEAKSGFAPAQLEDAARAAQAMSHVRVRGLMTIPPADSDRDTNIRYFQEVRALYVDINEKLFHNELKCLSMGMSGDFEDAIRNGATMVRVGTAIFGARYYPT